MIDTKIYTVKEFQNEEDQKEVKKAILAILSGKKVSLSEARAVFNDVLREIEDNNPVTL